MGKIRHMPAKILETPNLQRHSSNLSPVHTFSVTERFLSICLQGKETVFKNHHHQATISLGGGRERGKVLWPCCFLSQKPGLKAQNTVYAGGRAIWSQPSLCHHVAVGTLAPA